jgi:hypothetical protein
MSLEGKQFSHYRVLKLVGRGGMGEVYLAEDVQILRQVAVKFIRIEDVQFEQGSAVETLRLFWREAMNIAMLDHPNILPLYDHGEITLDEIRAAYLIIPYRPEGALNDWLRWREQMGQLSVKKDHPWLPQTVDLVLERAGKKAGAALSLNSRVRSDFPDSLPWSRRKKHVAYPAPGTNATANPAFRPPDADASSVLRCPNRASIKHFLPKPAFATIHRNQARKPRALRPERNGLRPQATAFLLALFVHLCYPRSVGLGTPVRRRETVRLHATFPTGHMAF